MAIEGVGFDSKETVQEFIDKINSRIQKRLLVAGMMPTASEEYKGQQILYVGPSTTTLNKGGVYECGEVAGTDPTEYEWTLISANPLEFNSEDFEVENNEVSLAAGQKIKEFTQAEWDALTTEEKVALAGQNVIITDDDTPVDVVDVVEDSNMNPVTSNAVFDAIASKLNVINGTRTGDVGVTVTFAVPSADFFLLVGGWNTSGYSYRALYYISLEPRANTVIVKSISKELGEAEFGGTVTGTYASNAITLSITTGQHENLGSVLRAFYPNRS